MSTTASHTSSVEVSRPTMTSTTWTSKQMAIAVLMVSTGSINTLAAKWADMLPDKSGAKFDHPFLQAVCMFIGEALCLPVFFLLFMIQKWRYKSSSRTDVDLGHVVESGRPVLPKFNPLIMLPAALCDMCATSIMYVGLNMTNAASFQMLRGSVIIFTGILSMLVLRTRLAAYRWLGMFTVLAGLIVVGMGDILYPDDGGSKKAGNEELLGDLLIVVSQMIVACQMVYEQKYVMKYDVPALLAVGLEGLFGGVILSLLCVPFYYIKVGPTFSQDPFGRLENVPLAFQQMGENPLILVALGGTILSIAFFNFAGISVTKEMNATTRMVLDSVRTFVIWGASLGLAWQHFVYLQIPGFVLLIGGMFVYNDLVLGPLIRSKLAPWLRRIGCGGLALCCNEPESDDEARPIVADADSNRHAD